MKIFTFLLMVTLTIEAESDQDRWLNFKLAHGKTYKNVQEELERFEIFQENLRNIEENNRRFESGEVSYKLGVNKFADESQDEFAASLSTGRINQQFEHTVYENEDQKNEYFNADIDPLPKSVDWRTSGVVSDVKDERTYYAGYSWAFSAAGAVESQFSIYKESNVSLSVQNLVDCVKLNDNLTALQDVYFYILANGISTEEVYPYSDGKGTCQEWLDVLFDIDNYITLVNEKYIKPAVATQGPVSVLIDGSKLANYESGIIDNRLCNTPTQNFNHAALVVGYHFDNVQDYYILKNSWGTDWGENGYFRLTMDNNTCGIGKSSIVPVVFNTTGVVVID